MKKLFTVILSVLLLTTACVETKHNLGDFPETCVPGVTRIDYSEELSTFLSTKAEAPLEETVWLSCDNDEFHKMLLFKDNTVNLFYGCIDNNEMQRWSDYYSAPYTIAEDGTYVVTDLTYPAFGKNEYSESITIVKSENIFIIQTENDTFKFVGQYNSSLDERWILVYVTIPPWE